MGVIGLIIGEGLWFGLYRPPKISKMANSHQRRTEVRGGHDPSQSLETDKNLGKLENGENVERK